MESMKTSNKAKSSDEDILHKRLTRRKALSTTAKIAIGVVVGAAVGGGIAYYTSQQAAKPAAPTTVTKVVTQKVTVSPTPSMTVSTTTTTPVIAIEKEPWRLIKWDKPSWEERLTEVKVGEIPKHWIERFPFLKTYKEKPIAAIGGYKLPEGWKEAVSGVDVIRFLNYGGLAHDPAIALAMCAFEDLTGIRVEAKEMEELTIWLKTVSIMTAKSDAIDMLHLFSPVMNRHVALSGWAVPVDFLWPSEAQKLYSPEIADVCKIGDHWYFSGLVSVKPLVPFFRPSWLKKATGSSEPPKTWVETAEVLNDVAKWIKENLGPGYYAMALPGKDHRYMWAEMASALYSLGGKALTAEGWMNVLTDEFKEVFKFFVNLGRSGILPKEALGWAWTDPGELFGKGKVCFINDGTVNITRFMNPKLAPGLDEDWVVLPPLGYDKGYPPATSDCSPVCFGVNPYTSPKKKAAAMLFLDFYRSYQAQWNELAFEGNETVAAPLYDEESVLEHVDKPDIRKEAVKVIRLELLPPGADSMLSYLLEWWQKAVLGEVDADEALKKAQEDIEAVQAKF